MNTVLADINTREHLNSNTIEVVYRIYNYSSTAIQKEM